MLQNVILQKPFFINSGAQNIKQKFKPSLNIITNITYNHIIPRNPLFLAVFFIVEHSHSPPCPGSIFVPLFAIHFHFHQFRYRHTHTGGRNQLSHSQTQAHIHKPLCDYIVHPAPLGPQGVGRKKSAREGGLFSRAFSFHMQKIQILKRSHQLRRRITPFTGVFLNLLLNCLRVCNNKFKVTFTSTKFTSQYFYQNSQGYEIHKKKCLKVCNKMFVERVIVFSLQISFYIVDKYEILFKAKLTNIKVLFKMCSYLVDRRVAVLSSSLNLNLFNFIYISFWIIKLYILN